jgi:uncharacterized membrane protein HdeD (DUF308 family)
MNFLKRFYFLRAAVAFGWVALVVLAAQLQAPAVLAAILLVLYPTWDAAANVLDARRSGGLAANPGQRLNVIISLAAAVALAYALAVKGNSGALLVFGAWALLSGLLQLLVGVRRRHLGGQAFMMISGAQSALAGVLMTIRAFSESPKVSDLAPYAAFGGFYFLLAGLRLAFRRVPAQAP